MNTPQRIARNASAGVAYVVVSAALMFWLYREILIVLGVEKVGIWSVVLASTAFTRLSELGLTAGSTKFVATHLAREDVAQASAVVQTTVLAVGVFLGLTALVGSVVLPYVLPHFLPTGALNEALGLIPIAFGSFWLSSMAGAALAALDGCRRYDMRAAIQLSTVIIYVALGLWWVRTDGLLGLAFAQVVQSGLGCAAAWYFLRRQLPTLPILPYQWSTKALREVVRYGGGFQLAFALQMLGDPITKVLMSRYGGLSAAGYFEMANQFVTKFTALLNTILQVFTAEVATWVEIEPLRVGGIFNRLTRLSGMITMPGYAVVVGIAPLVSVIWIGELSWTFIVFSAMLASGYAALAVASPAYFFLLGLGRIGAIVVSRVAIAIPSVCFAILLGREIGANGVAMGWALALAIGAGFLFAFAAREVQMTISLAPGAMLAGACIAPLIGGYLPVVLGWGGRWSLGAPLAALAFAMLCTVFSQARRAQIAEGFVHLRTALMVQF